MLRPNILLIQSDQHRFDCLGVNGHPLLKTPSLDGLAAEGVNFTHAFCPIPLCSPARASLLSGQWPGQHLQIANWDTEAPRPLREDRVTFSELLQQAGYSLHYVGKWHVHQTKDPTAYGFHTYIPEGAYRRWRAEQGLPPRPRQNGWFGEVDPYITPQQHRLAWGADRVIDLLRQKAADSRPFFIRWDPSEPHLPNVVPEPYASLYDPGKIKPWPSFGETFESKPYIQRQQLDTWRVADWTWVDWAPVVSWYLGEIALMDAQIGRVLRVLEDLGLVDNTLVIYTTDHGDMCGAHRMVDKHFIMYDDVVRVPLIARWPGVISPGLTCDAFVCNALDLARTFCEVSGVPVPDTFQGESLLPLFSGHSGSREDIFATYHGNQFGLYSQRMVRDYRWKYVWNATAEDELYDLESDPGELRNLASDPAFAGQLSRLRRRLVAWMEDTADPLLNAWTRGQLLG